MIMDKVVIVYTYYSQAQESNDVKSIIVSKVHESDYLDALMDQGSQICYVKDLEVNL